MKKAFGQTVRDFKRKVNKKVLKVTSIEQKVLDSTSNEPWGPHGSLLIDIAQATRNNNEYQIIMSVIWKRINDTGKNWRHVYKALAVLEYLVVHGSERIIDEIREHAYQINTLSDFQYVDSSGRDQGSNVRKKSQCLVVLVNDKERIQEVRQKASSSRDKYRSMSMGSMYRPRSSSREYGDRYDEDRYSDRYGIRDDDQIGYGREREWSHRDKDIYGRYGDSYGRNGYFYDQGYDNEHNSHYGYRDSDYRGTGTSRSIDEYSYGSRSRSFDRERDIAYDSSDQHSSRTSGANAEDWPQIGSPGRQRIVRKFSEQNLASLSYEEAVSTARSPTHSTRDVGTSPALSPKPSPPHSIASPIQDIRTPAPEPSGSSQAPAPENKNVDQLGEFDPHYSFLVGSLAGTSQGNSSGITHSEVAFAAPSSASTVANQGFDDPFGDGPFKAIPYSDGIPVQPPESLPSSIQNPYVHQPASQDIQLHSSNQQELSTSNQEIDILADILPPSGHSAPVYSQSEHPVPTGQIAPHMGFPPVQYASQTGFPHQALQIRFVSQNGPTVQQGFPFQPGQATSMTSFAAQPGQQSLRPTFQTDSQMGFYTQPPSLAFIPAQSAQIAPMTGFQTQIGSLPQVRFQASTGQNFQSNAGFYGTYNAPVGSVHPFPPSMITQVSTGAATHDNTLNFLPHHGTAVQGPSQMAVQSSQSQPVGIPFAMQTIPSSSAASLVTSAQPAEDKFETKSTIWTDTLNRGLVNLNISGPKTNPLADIGVDFDAINRKEKRMEKPANNTTAASTVSMGKAMGSGSGIGHAGAGALRPPQTQVVGPGVAIGGYGGIYQPMGMAMSRPMNMNMGMQMQQPTGFPPGQSQNITGSYHPLQGANNYGQLPYGGGYR